MGKNPQSIAGWFISWKIPNLNGASWSYNGWVSQPAMDISGLMDFKGVFIHRRTYITFTPRDLLLPYSSGKLQDDLGASPEKPVDTKPKTSQIHYLDVSYFGDVMGNWPTKNGGFMEIYPLVMTNIAMENMALIEIDDFPSYIETSIYF